jgi:hypothetical protein
MDNYNIRNIKRWKYNGKDTMYTRSIENMLTRIMERQDQPLQDFYQFQQHKVSPEIVTIMNRGVNVDAEQKENLLVQFTSLMEGCIEKINYIFMEEVNLNSTPQVKNAFKTLLGIKPIINRKTKSESFGSDAMLVYLEEYPEWRTLLTLFLEYKSIKVFVRTFLSAKLDNDGRMRCDYNPAGTKTYRLSSRKNVFGNGCVPLDKAEALTPEGWVSIRDQPGTIMQFTNQGILEFAESDWFITDFNGELYSYKGRCVQGEFTPGHRTVTKSHRDIASKNPRCYAEPVEHVATLKAVGIPVSGVYQGNSTTEVTDNWLQLEAAISADGSKESKTSWRIRVSKERKMDRLDMLLGVSTTILDSRGYAAYIIQDNNFTRIFPRFILDLSLRQRQLFIEEVSHWDVHRSLRAGRSGESFIYYTTIPENASFLQTLCHLSNYSASLTIDYTNSNEYGNTSTKPLYNLSVSKKIHNKVEGSRWSKVLYVGEVGCPIVKSGMWLIRYNNEIHITGNCNLANIPSHGKIDLQVSLQEIVTENAATKELAEDTSLIDFSTEVGTIYQGKIELPNVKRIFTPDSDEWIFWDGDYSAGDLHFVVWSADCAYLKRIMKAGGDVYSILASDYYQREITKADIERQIFKAVCHASNYLGKPTTIAAKAGLSAPRVKQVQDTYFKLCPEIVNWQLELENEARKTGCIRNIWGAKNEVWDFNDPMWLNKLVAWKPQSELGILVNKALVKLEATEQGKNIQTKLQTHDSLSGQFLVTDVTAPKRIKNYLEIEIPFKDKLIIPADVKISALSYGDCKKISKDSIYYLN